MPSQRITRSATARLQASNTPPQTDSAATTSNSAPAADPLSNIPPTAAAPATSTTARKRKASITETHPEPTREQRSSKRRRPDIDSTTASAGKTTMSSAGPSGSSAETSPQQAPRDSTRRKSGRKSRDANADPSGSSAPSRKSRKSSRRGKDVIMQDSDEKAGEQPPGGDDEDGDDPSRQDTGGGAYGSGDAHRNFPNSDELDALDRGEDPFASGYLARFGGHSGLSSSLRALSGIVSGTHSRLRNILTQLRIREDPSVQLIALQELSELLLVSNEDNLAGHFAPDQYVKELVTLMQPNPFTGEENPEIMLLACRCIANLMEALPAATASVVYGGAVPILCQKLLEIHFIDLAEQALSTLEKISVEFPSSIVREGGLTACLTYLDFFATSTQRTAVTTAANCCRNIPEDSFPTVRDVMPILLTTLSSNDQRVVEQASLCVSRVIDSFKSHERKLEELVSAELLKAILRLLLPGSTNLIGPSIHTQFLRVLSITARASPRLSAELLKMNVVDTLYHILTGVSPPVGTEGVAAKIDKNVIMQSIIRTPRESIFETLNVICELLPTVSQESLTFLDDLQDAGYTGSATASLSSRSEASPNAKRLELLKDCADEVKRFAGILFPTLMHAYTSTVNLSVRQKVLTAQLKMLSNLDIEILQEALRGVTYASHLASILSQQDNASLVTFALQAAELLLKRMESVYRPQFYREGVMAEIATLAAREVKETVGTDVSVKLEDVEPPPTHEQDHDEGDDADDDDDDADDDGEAIDVEIDMHDTGSDGEHADDEAPNQEDEDGDGDDDEDDEDDDDDRDRPDHRGDRSDNSEMQCPRKSNRMMDAQDVITFQAKRFVEAHGDGGSEQMRIQAMEVLSDIKSLADKLKACYSSSITPAPSGTVSFQRLAKYFGGDALESITSYELMTSGIVEVLLDIFTLDDEESATRARSDFLGVFMSTSNHAKIATGDANSPSTAFSVLVHKLQDLLSRSEHFEVITVSHNAFESNSGSAASMLAKQLRLKLAADEDSGIPRHFRNIMVSIHAIATFKALEDYLRPRITLSDRPRGARRDGISAAMAAYAAAMAGREDQPPSLPTLGSSLPTRSSHQKTPKARPARPDSSSQAEPGKAEDSSGRLRRSSRRQSAQASSIDPASQAETTTPSSHGAVAGADVDPGEDAADMLKALEAADEARISDDDDDGDDDDADIEADLDALREDLEDGALENDAPDPSAVNLEVAKSGKVTARTEDGARVGTPSRGVSSLSSRERMSATARLAAARQLLATPTSSARGMSYASALQQPPQDWHIEFSVNGQPIASDTTIYRACHFNQARGEEISARTIWSAMHTISFKRVEGPPPADRSIPSQGVSENFNSTGLPPSLGEHPVTSSILRLMSILHDLNLNLHDVLAEKHNDLRLKHEPVTQFINTKLTAKLNRQMDEPLIVASQCLPSWSEDLARLYPFLFPFETRHLFLQSTSFGYSRLMGRWQSAQSDSNSRRHRDERVFLGRIQRQKVRISRARILESAIKVMELYGSSSSVLEVEYFEEVGTGLGPTLEFYSTVSKEFCKKSTKMWRDNDSTAGDEYAFGKHGLFPRPMSEAMSGNDNGQRVLHLFKMLGKFVARSMLDGRIIDVSFNQTFFRIGDGASTVTPSLGAVATVDEGLATSLKMLRQYENAKKSIEEDLRSSPSQKAMKMAQISVNGAAIEDLALDFTLPGHPEIELQENGAQIDVTLDNVGLYIKKVIDFTLGAGVQKQVDAFRAGFSLVFPYTALKSFTPVELEGLFGRVEEDWSLATLMDSIKADHGYNLDSKTVRNLMQVMSEYEPQQKRDFLQFVTGSPKLPIGGFKALTPMFTVVCKPSEPPYSSDDYLPSVMTCVQYLKLPNYSSVEILKAKLKVAMSDGQGAFHLS